MKILLALALFALPAAAKDAKGLYALEANSIDGKPVKLSVYAGKVALVVNTASKCGFTPQYEGLQALYDKYKDRGFVVLGFPSNDFLGQEPESNEKIKKFCLINYGVDFPLFEKGPVKGKATQPVFKFLKASPVGAKEGEISWNFNKFLVNGEGEVVARWGSRTKPDAKDLVARIEALLPPAK